MPTYIQPTCGSSSNTNASGGLVKIWKTVKNAIDMLYEDTNDMAAALSVGVSFSRVRLRLLGEVLSVQIWMISPVIWVELWEKNLSGAHFVAAAELLRVSHHDELQATEEGKSSKVESSGSLSSHARLAAFPSPTDFLTSSGSRMGTKVEERGHCNSDLGSLEITIMAEGEPGAGIKEGALSLAVLPENQCCLSTILRLVFSMYVQPAGISMYDAKLLEVDIRSVFESPCKTASQREWEKGVQGEQSMEAESSHEEMANVVGRLGITHDSLNTSFKCLSPTATSLLTSKMLNASSLSVPEKAGAESMKGIGVGSLQLMGNVKYLNQSIYSQEESVTEVVDAVNRTADFFILDMCQRRPSASDILSFEVAHKPVL